MTRDDRLDFSCPGETTTGVEPLGRFNNFGRPQLSPSPALPQEGDLTLGHEAGTVLIGLTVRPAQPGPNTLLVYVLPLQGPVAAADVPVTLAVGGRMVPLDLCSRTCRTASVNLVGGEHVAVAASGPSGGTASFDLPALPAPDQAPLLQQVQARMHQLRSYRVEESLGPSTTQLQSSYAFQAPDRMQLDLGNGESTIWVGPTRYNRPDPSGPWRAETIGSSLPVPSFVWDTRLPAAAYVGAHLVGAETVDGRQTQTLAFFLSVGQTPMWFRLSVDADRLVHHAAMRAQGHFMDHRYFAFDTSLVITPPARGACGVCGHPLTTRGADVADSATALSLLRLERVAGVGPGLKPALERVGAIAVVTEEERHTGARVLLGSRTVRDDGTLLGQRVITRLHLIRSDP